MVLKIRRLLPLIAIIIAFNAHAQTDNGFRNIKLPLEQRVHNLISQLTIAEKVSLLGYQSKAVPRLGIPAYNWWNEALHGVARAGQATVFPQAIGMAATFNDSLVHAVADIISTEARAKYNLATRLNRHEQYMGLTFWSPNINIFRDPRWGRGQETYGEDPFLTAQMGAAFVKGMQGDNPVYLKIAACAKHFAVHSGPEQFRHSFNAMVDEKDLRETYLYAFHQLVTNAHVESVMCAYNRVNGKPCCINSWLIQDVLRQEWKFKGHVVSDCWALDDVYKGHKVLNSPVEVAAAALKAGINLDCSTLLQDDLIKAVEQRLVTVREIDQALASILRTQFKLGFFDQQQAGPYANLGESDVHASSHVALARHVARQSMVLLKNNDHLLPLNKQQYSSIMVLGPNAGSIGPLAANYHGTSGNMVTFIEGITEAAGAATAVQYDQGCDYTDTTRLGGVWAASQTDLTIVVIGLNPLLEGEEHDAFMSSDGGDKISLSVPPAHLALLKALHKNNKPVVVIVTGGSALDIAALQPYADAILMAWYPGEQGGNAAADILFGKTSPAGRLPVTFYRSLSDLPDYSNYNLAGRTYRYFKGSVTYPFGYGLSYTSFNYTWERRPADVVQKTDTLSFSIRLQNSGKMDGDEVLQAYIKYPELDRMPLQELKGFKRVTVKTGQCCMVTLKIPVSELQKWDLKNHKWRIYPGNYKLLVGSSSADIRLSASIHLQ